MRAHLRPGTPLLRSSLHVSGVRPIQAGGVLGDPLATDTLLGARVACLTGAFDDGYRRWLFQPACCWCSRESPALSTQERDLTSPRRRRRMS